MVQSKFSRISQTVLLQGDVHETMRFTTLFVILILSALIGKTPLTSLYPGIKI